MYNNQEFRRASKSLNACSFNNSWPGGQVKRLEVHVLPYNSTEISQASSDPTSQHFHQV